MRCQLNELYNAVDNPYYPHCYAADEEWTGERRDTDDALVVSKHALLLHIVHRFFPPNRNDMLFQEFYKK